jgi:hypothetical protein
MSVIIAAVLGLASLFATLPQQPAQTPDTWAPIRVLIGRWEGTSQGQPGKGTVRREYRLVLGEQFIEVRNTSTYPPQEQNPKGEVHEDLGLFSYDRSRKAFVFRQFHVEGFTNTYVSQSIDEKSLVFMTESIENIPAGWRARETYRVIGPDEVIERFELAEPGKDFTLYSETRLHRVR